MRVERHMVMHHTVSVRMLAVDRKTVVHRAVVAAHRVVAHRAVVAVHMGSGSWVVVHKVAVVGSGRYT